MEGVDIIPKLVASHIFSCSHFLFSDVVRMSYYHRVVMYLLLSKGCSEDVISIRKLHIHD